MNRWAFLLLMVLNACVPISQSNAPAVIADSTLPPMKTFGPARVPQTVFANSDLARDFLDLTFELESGRALPVFTRFEGPVTLRVTGTPPPTLEADLSALLDRFRTEAGIPITTTTQADASITIQAVSRAEIRRVLPQAACFVAPNVSSLKDYRRARRTPRTNWTLLETRTHIAIFVPRDSSPQETRDCLHEELAQALGPLNDLYRLPYSVFNDDNVHTILTHFDMLMLRATYAPELRSGMSKDAVARRLPAIMARINPAGQGRIGTPASATPHAWQTAIQTTLGPGASRTARSTAANTALTIAQREGWTDHRLAFTQYARGRVLQQSQPLVARQAYLAADEIYARSPTTQLHRAYVATQLAAYALVEGDGDGALQLITPYLAPARRAQNAALLATLQLMQAEALTLVGRDIDARATRLDSLGWARYGFGPDWAVRAKQSEISSLPPASPPA